MTTTRILRALAVAMMLGVTTASLSGCGHALHALLDDTPRIVQPTHKSVCPIPSINTPRGRIHHTHPGPNRVELQDPNEDDLAWSCAGALYFWELSAGNQHLSYPGSFEPFPNSRPWCRFADRDGKGTVEYHRLPPDGICSHSRLTFKTRPDNGHGTRWWEPGLRIWLRMEGRDPSTLVGNTYCHGWKRIDLYSPDDSPFFNATNFGCVRAHNALASIGPPGTFRQVKHDVAIWTALPRGGHGWWYVSHTATCGDKFQRRDCVRIP